MSGRDQAYGCDKCIAFPAASSQLKPLRVSQVERF